MAKDSAIKKNLEEIEAALNYPPRIRKNAESLGESAQGSSNEVDEQVNFNDEINEEETSFESPLDDLDLELEQHDLEYDEPELMRKPNVAKVSPQPKTPSLAEELKQSQKDETEEYDPLVNNESNVWLINYSISL